MHVSFLTRLYRYCQQCGTMIIVYVDISDINKSFDSAQGTVREGSTSKCH